QGARRLQGRHPTPRRGDGLPHRPGDAGVALGGRSPGMGALVELPGKVPPQSLEAERAVLGCILIEPSVLPRAIELVQPEDFYKEGHRKIFGAMLRLFERSEPADTLTVAEELRRAGALEEVGGQATLAAIREEATVAMQFVFYADLVR